MKTTTIHQGSTLLLRGVLLLIGLLVLALCLVALPAGIASDNTGYFWPILAGLYVPAVPFFFALYQAHKLLGLIDNNRAFSRSAVTILKRIKQCGLLISSLFVAGMPYIFYAADRDDAPGVVLIAMILAFVSFVVGIFAAVLQRLFQNAVDIKSENDLTV